MFNYINKKILNISFKNIQMKTLLYQIFQPPKKKKLFHLHTKTVIFHKKTKGKLENLNNTNISKNLKRD